MKPSVSILAGMFVCCISAQSAQPILISKPLAGLSNPGSNTYSGGAEFSSNGRFIAFVSSSDTLVRDCSNGPVIDVFIYDSVLEKVELVSADVRGTNGGDDDSGDVSISADGRYVAFSSRASNLVGDPSDGALHVSHVYLRDRVAGTTRRISGRRSFPGSESRSIGDSSRPVVTQDGEAVFFASESTALAEADSRPVRDLYLWKRGDDSVRVLSGDWPTSVPGPGGVGPYAVSADGNRVAYLAEGSRRQVLAPEAGLIHTDVFIRTLSSDSEQRLSIPKSTAAQTTAVFTTLAFVENPTRLVSGWKNAAPLLTRMDPLVTEAVALKRLPGAGASSYPLDTREILEAAGRFFVVNLLSPATATVGSIFQIWDSDGLGLEWMSSDGAAGLPVDVLAVSPSGRFIAVLSDRLPRLEPPAPLVRRLMVYDLETRQFEVIEPAKPGEWAEESAAGLAFSPDERFLAFEAAANDAAAGNLPGSVGLFLHTLPAKTPPPFRIAAALEGGQIAIRWPSVVGQRYRIELRSTLNAGGWTAAETVWEGSGAEITVKLGILPDASGVFLRLRTVSE